MKSYIILVLTLFATTCSAQNIIDINDKDQLMSELDVLIDSEYKLDPSKKFKIVLELKIDSIGEIHSCHVKWSKNLDYSKYYFFSKELESKYRVKFLFDEYKKTALMDKYAYCLIPFNKE